MNSSLKENTNYYKKYLKYKNKYIKLKNQFGGVSNSYTDLKLKLKNAISNENIVLTEEELRLLELTNEELEKLEITREQYEELKIKCKDFNKYKLHNQISDEYVFEDKETNKLNLHCNKIANLENFKLKKFELKNPLEYSSPHNQVIKGNDELPGSLFQLLDLFHRLPYEIQIFINRGIDGTIGLYLIKGKFDNTGNTQRRLCGINIHTHHYHLPQRKTDMKYYPLSSADLGVALGKIRQKINLKNHSFKLSDIKYDYIYDGHNLWYYKPNIPMINKIISQFQNIDRIHNELKEKSFTNEQEFINLNEQLQEAEEDQIKLLDIIFGNTDNNAAQFAGIKQENFNLEPISLNEYIDLMNNLVGQRGRVPDDQVIGVDIGLITESELKNKKSINIPDNLLCEFNEHTENHIILPSTGLLNNEDLELLYKKVLGIFEKQDKLKIKST